MDAEIIKNRRSRALYQIVVRVIERRLIFRDDAARNGFIERFGVVLEDTKNPCFLWAFIPNHFYLLLRTDTEPIAAAIKRLLTGYAVSINRRHRRDGHFFQNSIMRSAYRLAHGPVERASLNPRSKDRRPGAKLLRNEDRQNQAER